MGNEVSSMSHDVSVCCVGSNRRPHHAHPGHAHPKHPHQLTNDPQHDSNRLFHIIETGQEAILEAFLHKRIGLIDLNELNANGENYLHFAARHGQLGCVKILVHFGADKIVKNLQNKTASEVAKDSGHTFCAAFLEVQPHEWKELPPEDEPTIFVQVHSNNNSPEHEHELEKPRSHSPFAMMRRFPGFSRSREGSPTRRSGNSSPMATSRDGSPLRNTSQRDSNVAEAYDPTPARAIFDYAAAGATPFPPDKRPELSLIKGESLLLLEARNDGWALVRRMHGHHTEGFVPGNYISINGKGPLFDNNGDATEHMGEHAHKFRHLKSGTTHIAGFHQAHHIYEHVSHEKRMTRLS